MNGDGRYRALLALLLTVPAPSIGVLAALWAFPGPAGQAIYGLCKAWLLGFPLFWRVRVERAPISFSPPRQGGFVFGAVSGLVMGGAVAGAYLLLGSRLIDAAFFRSVALRNGMGTPERYLALALYLSLINSLLEEYVWRWFVFRRSEDLLPGAAAVAASGLFFTLHHTIALRLQFGWTVTLLSSLGIFAGAAVWSWCYLRYRSVWPGWLSHVLVDLAVLGAGYHLLFG